MPHKQDILSEAIESWTAEAEQVLQLLYAIGGQSKEIDEAFGNFLERADVHRTKMARAARISGDAVLSEIIEVIRHAETAIRLACQRWGQGPLQLHQSHGPSPMDSLQRAKRSVGEVRRLKSLLDLDGVSHPVMKKPLTDDECEIWSLLDGQRFTAKEMSQKLRYTPAPETVTKRIQRLRAKGYGIENAGGGTGYYRLDAPPPDLA